MSTETEITYNNADELLFKLLTIRTGRHPQGQLYYTHAEQETLFLLLKGQ